MKKMILSVLLATTMYNCFSQAITVDTWGVVNPFGIDRGNNRWESGRVNDVLEMDAATNSVLAIADMGGVWWLKSGGSWAVSMSRDWRSPNMKSLAKGIHPVHYYAGGEKFHGTLDGALYETDYKASAPLLRPWKEIPLQNVGSIYKVLVQESAGRIILGTQNGIWWSPIPRTNTETYRFTQVPIPGSCNQVVNDLSATTDNSFVISLRSRACAMSNFLFKASFVSNNALSIVPVTLVSFIPEEMSRVSTVSVASCKTQPQFLYAVASDNTGRFLVLLKSTDGGVNFSRVNWRPGTADEMGLQGEDRNNCIAVHPTNPQTLAIGWVVGPYISTTGGTSFTPMVRTNTHDDKVALEFSESIPDRLYICSDGGLASVNSIRQPNNIDYTWAKRMANLQFVGPTAIRQWWGRFDVELSNNTTQIGGGLQDNDNVYMTGIDRPWKAWESLYDGGAHFYLRCGGMIAANAGGWIRYRGTADANSAIPIPIKSFSPGANRNINTLNGLFCKVIQPQKRNASGQLMYAISTNPAGSDPATALNVVYGIFANADGSDINAEYLFTTTGNNEVTSSISSFDGTEIIIGKRTSGRVMKMVNRAGTLQYDQVNALNIQTGNNFMRQVGRTIDVGNSTEAYAMANDEFGTGKIYYAPDGVNWREITGNLPRGTYYAMDHFKNKCRNVLLVATDEKVYACTNNSGVWTDISGGLPARAHASDIHVIPGSGCTTDIYLSTFGWSVWKTTLR